jgi:hypothetical protein
VTPGAPSSRAAPDARRFLPRFVVASALLFVITLMWTIASPVPSAPDENAQMVKAAATARGTLIGTPIAGKPAYTTVRVPETIEASQKQSDCSYYTIDVPACRATFSTSSRLVSAPTYVGRYPPLYYFLTGLPTLVSGAHWTLHAMRAVSALIVALLLGLAFACVTTYGESGLLTLATGVIVTPTVLYIGSAVNPSAMEIGGAVTMWAALAVLVSLRSTVPPTPLVVSAVIGAVALCASRPLSTFWYALIVASCVYLRPRASRALLRARSVRLALVGTLAFAFLCGVFVLAARSYELEPFPIPKQTASGYVLADVGHGYRVLRQVIGAFGTPDFSLPVPLLAVWLVAGFGIIALAIMLGTRHDAIRIGILTAVFGFVLPFVIIYTHIQTDGVIWQGRYSLPIIAGLPLLSALALARRFPSLLARLPARLTWTVVGALALGNIGAFYWVLRRYTVGLATTATNAFHQSATAWQPLLPTGLTFAIAAAGTIAFAWWLGREVGTPGRSRAEQPEEPVVARAQGPGSTP